MHKRKLRLNRNTSLCRTEVHAVFRGQLLYLKMYTCNTWSSHPSQLGCSRLANDIQQQLSCCWFMALNTHQWVKHSPYGKGVTEHLWQSLQVIKSKRDQDVSRFVLFIVCLSPKTVVVSWKSNLETKSLPLLTCLGQERHFSAEVDPFCFQCLLCRASKTHKFQAAFPSTQQKMLVPPISVTEQWVTNCLVISIKATHTCHLIYPGLNRLLHTSLGCPG